MSFSPIVVFRAALASFLLSFLFAAGCVTPPDVEESQVIPNRELQLLSSIKKGKDYAAAGRLDLAEIEFRKAARLDPKLSSIYNDLGYTLMAQDRNDEAAEAFQTAIRLEPKNVAARENYARLLYARGDVESSIKEYEDLLGIYYGLTAEEVRRVLGKEYTPGDVAGIYRALSVASYSAGRYDEAICYSQKALSAPMKDFSQVGQHARLLLSLGLAPQAAAYLHDVVVVWQDQTPGRIFIDYGLALLDTNDPTSAQESFTRAQTAKDIDEADRRDIRLLLAIAQSAGAAPKQNGAAAEPDARASVDEDPDFCRFEQVDRFHYWPSSVVGHAQDLLKTWCNDEKQSFVSGQSGTV